MRLYPGPAAVVSAGDRTRIAPIREGVRPRQESLDLRKPPTNHTAHRTVRRLRSRPCRTHRIQDEPDMASRSDPGVQPSERQRIEIPSKGRDVIVIGPAAGGLDALLDGQQRKPRPNPFSSLLIRRPHHSRPSASSSLCRWPVADIVQCGPDDSKALKSVAYATKQSHSPQAVDFIDLWSWLLGLDSFLLAARRMPSGGVNARTA